LSDAESELSEALDDVPAFESEKGLLKWLEVGKTKLQSILSKMQKPDASKKSQGPYYKSKVGATPSARTDRLR
jgi:hypothetical protein